MRSGCDASGGRGAEADPEVRGQLHRDRPNELWVAGITYLRNTAGWVYAAFVLDVSADAGSSAARGDHRRQGEAET